MCDYVHVCRAVLSGGQGGSYPPPPRFDKVTIMLLEVSPGIFNPIRLFLVASTPSFITLLYKYNLNVVSGKISVNKEDVCSESSNYHYANTHRSCMCFEQFVAYTLGL